MRQEKLQQMKMKHITFCFRGDNLHSLKLLEKTYKGKIDVIYIDPPYNREKTILDTMIITLGNDDAFRHSKWTSFIGKRLEQAHYLLSDDGIFFTHIDDNDNKSIRLISKVEFSEREVVKNNFGFYHINDFITTRGEGGVLINRKNLRQTVYYNPETGNFSPNKIMI